MAFRQAQNYDYVRGHYRAQFQPRRGGFRTVRQPSPPPSGPLGSILQSITRQDLESKVKNDAAAHLTDCKFLASYNWLDKSSPTITVPGMPPKWTPPAQVQQLEEDSGTYYRDPNAAKYPAHPIEPAVMAILQTDPDSLSKIDIFGCASTLGNLLRFVQGDSKPFRILVDVIGTTVHLIRRENSPRETIPDVRGYGHTFPEAYTSWDSSVRGSSSHQRIIHYCLGGLKLAVRFEGDGYLPHKIGASSEKKAATENASNHEADQDLTEAVASWAALSQAATSELESELQIISAGEPIPQSAVFDLKTRSVKRKPDEDVIISGELPRLWLRQIPHLILAYHSHGKFHDVQILDVQEKVKEWEVENEVPVRTLIALLQSIVELARTNAKGKLEITVEGGQDCLALRDQLPDTPNTFSQGVREQWERWLDGEACNLTGGAPLGEGRGSKVGFTVAEALRRSMLDLSDNQDDSDENEPPWEGWDYGDSDEGGEKDLTACDKECGYCGRCDY